MRRSCELVVEKPGLAIRGGMGARPGSSSVRLGCNTDVAVGYHLDLSPSTAISLTVLATRRTLMELAH